MTKAESKVIGLYKKTHSFILLVAVTIIDIFLRSLRNGIFKAIDLQQLF